MKIKPSDGSHDGFILLVRELDAELYGRYWVSIPACMIQPMFMIKRIQRPDLVNEEHRQPDRKARLPVRQG